MTRSSSEPWKVWSNKCKGRSMPLMAQSKKLRAFMISHASYFEENYWGFVCMLIGNEGMANPDRSQFPG